MVPGRAPLSKTAWTRRNVAKKTPVTNIVTGDSCYIVF
ncbi:hypothetical protein FM107_16995 [Sphingobacterium sp. JB170]|nr:hypothetical protein FM107_16995 [Sphingobacterium sp. JB170]